MYPGMTVGIKISVMVLNFHDDEDMHNCLTAEPPLPALDDATKELQYFTYLSED